MLLDYNIDMTSGLWVTLTRRGLVPVFWLVVMALRPGALLALLPERKGQHHRENETES